ncbi:MAG: hypothetical protein GQ563_07410, partial [Desulfuromusa sp.]|nr:hypothetical protein [Desulfuromusa sp.]
MIKKITQLLIVGFCAIVLCVSFSAKVFAECSSYMGRATLNELFFDNKGHYVEIKILDLSILPAVYGSWSYRICNQKEGCTSLIPIPSDSTGLPWVVSNSFDRKYLDFSKGIDVLLVDGSGLPIDYLSVVISPQEPTSCNFTFDTTAASTNSFILGRFEDGTGDWSDSSSGNSGEESEKDTNDLTPNRLFIETIYVVPGQDAIVTFSLVDRDGNPIATDDPVTINFSTLDGTATSGEDYINTSGVLTIPAGSSQGTISLGTLIAAQAGEYFNLFLTNPTNVTILNNYPQIIFLEGPKINHLRIEHQGSGLTCQSSSITLRACADETCSSEADIPVTIDLLPVAANPPTWLGGNVLTFTGHQTVQLRQTVPGTLTLGLTNPDPLPTENYRCYNSGVEGNCNIDFYDSGFVFDVPDLTSCQTSTNVSIQAIRTDETTQTCVAAGGFSNVNKTVNFWSTYVNQATGSEQVNLSGADIATSSPGTGISMNFDASASANFTVNYPDAGLIQLHARYDGVGVEEVGLIMLGNDSFTVRPVGLCIYSGDANADCATGNGSCSVFKRVDEIFNLKVKGVCWESSGDTDFCNGNSITPNFQLNSIPINHNLIAPVTTGVSAGSIAVSSIDISAVDNGEHIIATQTVSEVGVFTFTATPPNYLGASLPVATSMNIGRFIPDHFVTAIVDHGVFQDACTGFTYTGQEFSYAPPNFPEMVITATGSAGNTTVNYRDDFVKLTNPATQISMPAVTADASHTGALGNPLALIWAPAASNLVQNDDGTLNFTLGADQFTYTRDANAMVVPFTSDIPLSVAAISDSDGIAATGLPTTF